MYQSSQTINNAKKKRLTQHSFWHRKNSAGFTIMEIVVATTLFAVVSTALMALFNYTLKINRRTEALRQATQGMRNFVELLVKEVRNGQINYFVVNGSVASSISPLGPCTAPPISLVDLPPQTYIVDNTYEVKENKIGVINSEGVEECIYFADEAEEYVPLASPNAFSAPNNSTYKIILERIGGVKEVLNPINYRIESLMFLIRPLCDPYAKCASYSNDYPKTQPAVTIMIKFTVQLPTGERVPILYQTSVSTNKYDIPNF